MNSRLLCQLFAQNLPQVYIRGLNVLTICIICIITGSGAFHKQIARRNGPIVNLWVCVITLTALYYLCGITISVYLTDVSLLLYLPIPALALLINELFHSWTVPFLNCSVFDLFWFWHVPDLLQLDSSPSKSDKTTNNPTRLINEQNVHKHQL